MTLVVQLIFLTCLAGAFALGLVRPQRRGYAASIAIVPVLVGSYEFRGDVRFAILFLLLGSFAAVISFTVVADLGLATRLLLIRVGIVGRIRPDQFWRPGRDDDKIALLMAVSLFGWPLAAWMQQHELRGLVSSAVLGLIYGSWSLRRWHRLRPICLRLRQREMLRRRCRAERTCVGCGYDLTGNVTGRCSECGRKIDPELHRRLLATGPIPR